MFINLSPGTIGIKAGLSESIDLAKRHNFSGIDFSIVEATKLAETDSVESVRALFHEAGIKIGCFGFPVDFRKDEAAWKDGLAALPAQARTAQELGALRSATFIMPCDNERNFDENFAFHAERLRPAAQILADYGIGLGLEWVGPATLREGWTYSFIHTMDGMLELCKEIGTGNVGLLVDAYHVYTSHGTNDDIRRLAKEQVVNVHVNDAPLGREIDEQLDGVRDLPTATGVLDLADFLHALRDIGYDGPVTAEPFSQRLREMSADDASAETSAAMHKMWNAAGFSSR